MTTRHTPVVPRGALAPALALALAFLALSPGVAIADAASKKELAARIVRLQQPGIQAMARNLAEQPAADLMNRAGAAIATRVPAERREAVAREVEADAKRYADIAVPLVQQAATRLAPLTLGALLEEKFSEDELRQIATIIETPAYLKFQQMGDEMQRALVEKLVAETRPSIEPRLRTLDKTIGDRIAGKHAPAPAAASASRAAPPARPASR